MEYAVLEHNEPVRLDPEPLGALHRELGPAGAENVISRALEELSCRVAQARVLYLELDLQGLAKLARSLVAIGNQVGMTRLAQVAQDVSICAARGEMPAIAATLSRLDRLADQSLVAIWDLQDMRV